MPLKRKWKGSSPRTPIKKRKKMGNTPSHHAQEDLDFEEAGESIAYVLSPVPSLVRSPVHAEVHEEAVQGFGKITFHPLHHSSSSFLHFCD